MNSVRKKLLQEIDEKIARKKALRKEVAERKDDVEVYVLKLMEAIDESMSKTVNTSLNEAIIPWHVQTLENDIKMLDPQVKVVVSWGGTEEQKHVNGVHIKWSPQYQAANSCDPERYVDISGLLFK